jgi:hypothetical protein
MMNKNLFCCWKVLFRDKVTLPEKEGCRNEIWEMRQQHLKAWVAVYWMTADWKVTSAVIREADRRARHWNSSNFKYRAYLAGCWTIVWRGHLVLVRYGAEKARAKTCLRSTAL